MCGILLFSTAWVGRVLAVCCSRFLQSWLSRSHEFNSVD